MPAATSAAHPHPVHGRRARKTRAGAGAEEAVPAARLGQACSDRRYLGFTNGQVRGRRRSQTVPGLEASLADLRARGLAEDSPQITYHLQQIDRLRANLQTGGDTPRRQTPREGDSSA